VTTTPAQDRVFVAALRTAAAIRETARERALIDFDPTDPLNFPLYVAAVTAADSTFKASVVAAAAAANITLTPPGPPS
jgi:hypothetical protein